MIKLGLTRFSIKKIDGLTLNEKQTNYGLRYLVDITIITVSVRACMGTSVRRACVHCFLGSFRQWPIRYI